MSFTSGNVSFCRFRCLGDGPASIDQTTFDLLKQFSFKETDIGVPDEVEVGFTTGVHLFDTEFSYDKNGFGHLLMFAMRIDTHKVPSETKKAYQKINELAAAEGNPTGFASKAEKREAKETANRQIHEDLAAGKYRKSKTVDILWDLSKQVLYLGSTSPVAVEHLVRLFRDCFEIDLDYMSAGMTAGHYLRNHGKGRDYEDMHPSAFTRPPAEAVENFEDADGPGDINIPVIPWVAKAVDVKDFIGNEFLVWLWWITETAEGCVEVKNAEGQAREYYIAIDKTLDMDCAWGVRGKQTLRADGPTRLNEAGEALAMGKWPRKAGLILSDGEFQWELTLQADSFSISGARLPAAEDVQHPREILDHRLAMTTALAEAIGSLFIAFIDIRCSGQWAGIRSQISQWIGDRRVGVNKPTAQMAGV